MLKSADDDFGARPNGSRENTQTTIRSEADHRIFNSLAMVSALVRVQAAQVRAQPSMSGAEAEALLEDAAARIDTVARLHRLVAESGAPDDLDAGRYLQRIAEYTGALGRGETRMTCDLAEGMSLDGERLAAVGLIANEALTNAFKHAHPAGAPGEIRFSCRRISGDLVLVIEDDGVGLPVGFNPGKDGGLGFRVMRGLAEQLGGRLAHQSTPLGLKVELLLPL